jgi:predicted RNase H-like nuclease (RuvC/YqgF family)
MRQIRVAMRAIIIAALGMVGLPACESQAQRQRIEALSSEIAQLQRENSRLNAVVARLTKETDDLKVQLETARATPAPAKR